MIREVAQKSMDLNYDGLMIEVHPQPEVALSDPDQQITPAALGELLSTLEIRSEHFTDPVFLDLLGELREKINSTLNSLPEKCQNVFRLSRFESLSYKEISIQLNISVKTVENHMGKALKLMREGLEDYLPLFLIMIILAKAW